MIFLSDEEKKIFELIKEYALSLKNEIVPRVAGGWVRDKIMLRDSSDIDIVLNNISGYDFATGLSKFSSDTSSVHKILANPEKSKHLETAICCVYGRNIDFVQLRSEVYRDSRIPDVMSAGPIEDAMRRDLTINSLFYNLTTNEVEDFTGRGVNDI